jgi:hypothetical protein
MVNVVGSKDDPLRWKPKGFEKHLLIGEVAAIVQRDKSRIKAAEKAGYIPAPIRVKVGRTKVRLYTRADVAKIKKHFDHAKPGPRPKS